MSNKNSVKIEFSNEDDITIMSTFYHQKNTQKLKNMNEMLKMIRGIINMINHTNYNIDYHRVSMIMR